MILWDLVFYCIWFFETVSHVSQAGFIVLAMYWRWPWTTDPSAFILSAENVAYITIPNESTCFLLKRRQGEGKKGNSRPHTWCYSACAYVLSLSRFCYLEVMPTRSTKLCARLIFKVTPVLAMLICKILWLSHQVGYIYIALSMPGIFLSISQTLVNLILIAFLWDISYHFDHHFAAEENEAQSTCAAHKTWIWIQSQLWWLFLVVSLTTSGIH